MFAVMLVGTVVPALGYSALFNIFAIMASVSLFINWNLKYTFTTFMPFEK